MKQKFTENQKRIFVRHYLKGVSAKELYTANNIPKSTFYDWVNRYSEVVKTTNEYKFYTENKKTQSAMKKTADIISILQIVDCKPNDPLKLKLIEISKLYGQYSVRALCEAVNVSRGTFYNHLKRNKKDKKLVCLRREELKPIIKGIFEEFNQFFGSRKMKAILNERGYIISRELASKLMKEMNLYPISLNSKNVYKRNIAKEKSQNLLKNNFKASRPNKVWVSDFTSIRIKDSVFYICVIIDLYSRKVISHSTTYSQTTNVLNKVFRNAIKSRNLKREKLIFHSDRGAQFTSKSFRDLLSSHGITQSFSERGNPYNNSVAESFFSHAKTEEFYRRIYKTKTEFIRKVDNYILNYNEVRPHKTNGYLTPTQKETKYFSK